ncbi:hypothetical protein GCM10009639_64040 [Kitasatospora putterlickiae]|uniref:Uncharacterized protein n=1 Tax=Kitasatospora putterlickiae TaxID=221725 RepID=A0ABP4J4G7_9ACTN
MTTTISTIGSTPGPGTAISAVGLAELKRRVPGGHLRLHFARPADLDAAARCSTPIAAAGAPGRRG